MSSTLTVKVGGTAYTLIENTLKITNRVDDKDKATFTLRDDTGTVVFSKGQMVSIVDSSLGTLFAGFVNKPTMSNLFPSATNLWSMDCVDQFYVPAKRTHKRMHKNQHAGPIAALQVQQYLAPDGVSGNFGLDWTELQSDWQNGTLSGAAAATNASTGNTGGGDLELAVAGSVVTFSQTSQADFNAGITGGGLTSPASGGVTFTPTQAIKFAATESLPGITNPALKMKIWSGSYTIAASDYLIFDVWTADSSPQQMATVDLVMTDGTTLSLSQAAIGVDVQGVGPGISNDLSGLATNTWYNRRFFLDAGGPWVGKVVSYAAVCFGGANQGNYTAYFRNVLIQNGGITKLTIFGPAATATQTTPQPVQNSGYTNISCSVVTSYERHGALASPLYDLSGAAIANSSQLTWSIILPNNSFTYSVTASIDSGVTFLPCTNQGAIPGLLPGMNLSGVKIRLTYVFDNAGNDPTLTPLLSTITGTINPSYASTKSDIVNVNNGAAAWNAGTLTNLNLSGSNTLQLNGYARNWDDANYGSQTLYGATSPAQGVLKKQFFLTSGTGTDVKSRMDFAGSNWQNFTMECDVTLLSGNCGPSLVYRTTNWGTANDSYAYMVYLNTTLVQLGHGTNSTGAGAFTNISTVALTLTAGTTYRLKVIVNGNNHQVFVNDVNYINVNDSTYTAAGYVGLRLFNGSGSTQTATFDNFGIMATLSGTWVSPAIDIHSLTTISNSQIILQIDPSVNTSISTFLVEISLNNGSTWTTCPNALTTPLVLTQGYFQSLPVPGLSPGTNVSSYTQVKIRLTISASTAATNLFMPDIQAVTLFVVGAYSSTGTRSNAPLAWDSMTRLPVGSGWGNASNGQAYTQVGTGTTAVTSNEATITNTTGDVHMRPGSATQQDTDGTVRFSLSASAMTAGMELHYNDSSHYYRLVASTTSLNIVRNSGAGNVTVATSSVTLTTGTFYRMRFRAVASGLTSLTLYGRVWLDGTTEPTNTWNVTVADSLYKPTVLADAPIRYYRLNDTNTTAVDIGSGAQNGTLHGTITESQSGLLTGDSDNCMLFDGSTGYVSLPTTGLPTGASAWSIEAWCKISAIPSATYHSIASFGTYGTNQKMAGLSIKSSGTTAQFMCTTYNGDILSSNISANTAYHVVGTYDGTNTRLYVNGALAAGPTPFTLTIALAFASIGAENSTAQDFFSGLIDEVAIYSTALSAAQIANHYNTGIASGGFALMANGTGVASFDSFRVTAYPDPSAPLTNAGRANNSVVNWNANLPANTGLTVYTSTDNGVTFQQASAAGNQIPGISTLLYSTLVFQRKPSGYYHLSESSGTTANDSSGNAYSGTLHGGVTLGAAGALQGPGELGNTSMSFDGSTGFIQLASALKTDGWSNLSVSCWFNTSASVGSVTRLLANDNPAVSHNGIDLGLNASLAGCFCTIGNGATSATATFSTALLTGTWYHLLATWDGTTIKLSLNGAQQASIALSGSVGTAAQALAIGYNPALASNFFKGSIAEVDLANPTTVNAVAPLTAADVLARYNAGLSQVGTVANDSFTSDTHTSYTSTFGSGGGVATWTWDTANSRLIAVGGTKAILLYNNLGAYDNDLWIDLYQSENAGLVWGWQNASNYYELIVKDSGASVSPNTVILNKISGGVTTQLATASITFQAQTHHRFHVTMLAGTITVSMDENQVLAYTDSTPLPAGSSGLRNDVGTSYIYLLQITPQPANLAATALCSKHVLTTSSPTATPQVTDHQAFAADSSFGVGVLVPSADYRQAHVSDNIDDLNTKSNYWWSINGQKNITFQARTATNSPYILQSTDILLGTMPTVEYSGDLYRNRQILKGVYDTATFGEVRHGDGQTRTWALSNPVVAPPTITLNGLAVSVGLQGKDSGRQYYYTLNGSSIVQDNSQVVLQATDTLAITYTGSFGIDFSIDNTGQFPNTVSQAQLAAVDNTTGIVEQVEDVSQQAMNKAAATAYANQLLQRYGTSGARTIKCQTLHAGLKAGQSLPIFIPQLNIFDSVFLIVEVGISARTISTPTGGAIQYVFVVTASEAAALASWAKMFNKIMRSISGSKPSAKA